MNKKRRACKVFYALGVARAFIWKKGGFHAHIRNDKMRLSVYFELMERHL